MTNSPFDCVGKIGFETRSLALKVSQRVGKKSRKERKAYFCRFCGKWHLGNYYLGNPKKQRAAVTSLPEMLSDPTSDEAEVIVDGRVVYVKTGVPFQ